jgi:hypothetical protein
LELLLAFESVFDANRPSDPKFVSPISTVWVLSALMFNH